MKREMKKFLIFLVIIFVQLFIFFRALFPPHFNLLFTPDLGQSDIYHENFSSKKLLSENLKNFQIPVWTELIGNGTPFLAEGQSGIFNVFNLVIFYFFPFSIAFNLIYLIIFLFNAIGTYLLGRKFKFSYLQRIFFATIYTFSGYLIVQMTHLNLLLALSFLPWLLYFIILFWQTNKYRYLIIFSFFLSQQIFAGHPQSTFISLFLISGYLLTKSFNEKKFRFKKMVLILLFSILGFVLSAVQILPSIELKNIDQNRNNISFEEITRFRYPYSELKKFINPYLNGNPKLGTYQFLHSKSNDMYIFWENTGYIGILPLLLFFFFIYKTNRSKQDKKNLTNPLLIPLIISFILIFGKDSPLYFLFTIPPFNLFRVPSRFLIVVVFAISVLATDSIKYLTTSIKNKKIKNSILVFLILLSFLDLYLNFSDYHLYVNNKKLTKEPESLEHIKNTKIFTDNKSHSQAWNYYFFKGWSDENPYLHFKNYLLANANIIYNTSSINNTLELQTSRYRWNLKLLDEGILEKDAQLVFTPFVNHFLDTYSVKHFLSTKKVTESDLILKKEIIEKQLPPVYIYENTNYLPDIRIVDNAVYANTIKNLIIKINHSGFNPETTIALENKDLQELIDPKKELKANIKSEERSNTYSKLITESNKRSFLTYNSSFYPGWKAYINGAETEIYPANVNQKMIILPEGDNIVEFKYQPKSVHLGARITIITHLTLLLFLILFADKSPKTPQLFSHPHSN